MAQLFTVYFPKCHFVLQKEFFITFTTLPFDYGISNNGIVYVENVHWQDNRYTDIEKTKWRSFGLQEGLTIISINDINLLNIDDDDDDDDDETHPEPLTIHTVEQVEDIIVNNEDDKNQITITFREELFPIDDSLPIGLSWRPDLHLFADKNLIKDKQIMASSCESTQYSQSQCRFNNPSSYWRPSLNNELLRNCWIAFDLEMKTLITKIYIQGSQDHKEYVNKLWIDYSDDGCEWNQHPMRCIK